MNYDALPRFDMRAKIRRCKWYLKPVIWLICLPGLLRHRTKITKIGLKGLKPPYLLLGNHNAFFDMNVSAMVTFPDFCHYIVAIDGFWKREQLLRNIGCICKRKFTQDISVIRHVRDCIRQGESVAIYPEARYSLCGTTAPLPEALGQMCKSLGVPVVSVICHGHHINHPFWNTRHERGVKPTEATVQVLFTAEELSSLTAEQINQRLVETFRYDDFAWQKERGIRVTCADRAEGLEKILYRCPACHTEFEMASAGTRLFCRHCQKGWQMTELGELQPEEGEGYFSHIPSWYEWERQTVREEVEAGTYSSGTLSVSVESLPNADRYVPLGKGTLIHDMQGFRAEITDEDGEVHTMVKEVPSMYSCHVEYRYLFTHGDCVDLNTLQDTWYVYPEGSAFSVTKMALATEELYYRYRREQGKPCLPGLV